jgi:hypothetical protein
MGKTRDPVPAYNTPGPGGLEVSGISPGVWPVVLGSVVQKAPLLIGFATGATALGQLGSRKRHAAGTRLLSGGAIGRCRRRCEGLDIGQPPALGRAPRNVDLQVDIGSLIGEFKHVRLAPAVGICFGFNLLSYPLAILRQRRAHLQQSARSA